MTIDTSSFRSIFYIDDDANLRALLKSSVERAWPHCRVACYDDPDDLLAALALAEPDIVLMDYMMPSIGADALLRKMREISSVPVIIISGASGAEMGGIENEKGISGVLQKPFSMKTLPAEIARLYVSGP